MANHRTKLKQSHYDSNKPTSNTNRELHTLPNFNTKTTELYRKGNCDYYACNC